ncbi:MauE/DoxX family redox-associated membrane protein, partial [Jatrophihabitans endophyticus]|uniref:MauE/DoxX family redox-associated membrane protein n=1 Tax=Jatrophihabitans endophyticus TaxID=1206085 RepID=UPI0026F19B7F
MDGLNWPALRPWLGSVIRLVLGGIWIWAAVSKLGEPRTFTQTVRAYQATPEWLSKAIGYGLPVLELIVGVLLVLGLATRLAAAVSGVLFVVFLVGLVQAAARGIQLECGCFGGGGASTTTHYTLDIIRDLVLLALAAFLVVWAWTRISVDEYLARHDHVEVPSAKRLRSSQGRRKYEADVAAASRKARSRDLWVNGSLAGVVILVCLIGIGVQSSRATIQGSLTAKNVSLSTGITYGKPAAADVYVYEDFQCPHCEDFEKSAGAAVVAAAQANRAQVHFYPIDILNSSEDGFYSEKAENAAICAADISVDDFVAFHRVLYGKIKGTQVQPAEG